MHKIQLLISLSERTPLSVPFQNLAFQSAKISSINILMTVSGGDPGVTMIFLPGRAWSSRS